MKEAFGVRYLVLKKNGANNFWAQLLRYVRGFDEALPVHLLEHGRDFVDGVFVLFCCGL